MDRVNLNNDDDCENEFYRSIRNQIGINNPENTEGNSKDILFLLMKNNNYNNNNFKKKENLLSPYRKHYEKNYKEFNKMNLNVTNVTNINTNNTNNTFNNNERLNTDNTPELSWNKNNLFTNLKDKGDDNNNHVSNNCELFLLDDKYEKERQIQMIENALNDLYNNDNDNNNINEEKYSNISDGNSDISTNFYVNNNEKSIIQKGFFSPISNESDIKYEVNHTDVDLHESQNIENSFRRSIFKFKKYSPIDENEIKSQNKNNKNIEDKNKKSTCTLYNNINTINNKYDDKFKKSKAIKNNLLKKFNDASINNNNKNNKIENSYEKQICHSDNDIDYHRNNNNQRNLISNKNNNNNKNNLLKISPLLKKSQIQITNFNKNSYADKKNKSNIKHIDMKVFIYFNFFNKNKNFRKQIYSWN